MTTNLAALKSLAQRFDGHLLACSAIAGAAALAPSAEADIISASFSPGYTVADGAPSGGKYVYYIDIETFTVSDTFFAGADFEVAFANFSGGSLKVTYVDTKIPLSTDSEGVSFLISPKGFDAGPGLSLGQDYAPNLAFGATISSAGTFSAAPFPGEYWVGLYSNFLVGTGYSGEFQIGKGGPGGAPTGNYVGFKFVHDTLGTTHYGWMGLSLSGPYGSTPTITGIGWEDIAGVSITAGAVPEPTSMGLAALALGACGLSGWRRKRENSASA